MKHVAENGFTEKQNTHFISITFISNIATFMC